MTVSSQTRGITFTGTGSASPFPLPFRFFNNSEITAYLVEDNGALTLLSQGVDYTLTGAGEPEIDGGAIGTLTKIVPLAIGKKMYVARTIPAVQQADIVNQGEFFASLHEDVFDRLTMVDQQHAEELSRCVKTSPTDEITPDQLLANIKASENSAAASAASASASATSAAASFDEFDDRYLGAKSSDPATDNDGQPLIVGALYWNTPLAKMKAWDGSAWTFWSGDISGPAISTDTAIAIFDGKNGKLVKSSTAKVTAAGEVVTNGVQVGQSGTASNNFHWRNLLDGVFRLTRGNAGSPFTDVMTVNADNSVSFPGNVASGVLGAGQTWQDVTSSRVSGTTYTNSTGKPICVSVFSVIYSNGINVLEGYVQGVLVARQRHQSTYTEANWISFIVPNGSTYSTVSSGAAIGAWMELR